jgi:signal transduction histidine kinase
VGLAVLAVGSTIAIRLDRPPGGAEDFLFVATIIVGGPVLLGRLVRTRVKLNQALRDKAAAAEDEREARAAAAVAGERARIAGELHHLVSDALASMVEHATAAEELARSRPEGAETALASVETTGRTALGEIRGLLGVLRHEDAELALAPQPSLAHVADLIARVRASGLPVRLDVEGERAPLPAGIDLTAYRVVQEALAGALEAADPRSAEVHVRYGQGELGLEVTDVGEAPPDGERALLGMHERVALYGGELVAEPVDGSGYAVRARLPLEVA